MKVALTPSLLRGLALAVTSLLLGNSIANAQFKPPALDSRISVPYPEAVANEGILEGSVTLQLELDETGRVQDWLPVATTHEGFVRQVEPMVGNWRFRPATRDGAPVASGALVNVQFRRDSMVSMSVTQMGNAFFNKGGDLLRSRVARISDLDAMPKPVSIVLPPLDDVPEEQRTGSAVVSFYIDEGGRVRLPVLTSVDCDEELAGRAFGTIREWRFAPPTVNGRPVLVRAQQQFVFDSGPVAAAQGNK